MTLYRFLFRWVSHLEPVFFGCLYQEDKIPDNWAPSRYTNLSPTTEQSLWHLWLFQRILSCLQANWQKAPQDHPGSSAGPSPGRMCTENLIDIASEQAILPVQPPKLSCQIFFDLQVERMCFSGVEHASSVLTAPFFRVTSVAKADLWSSDSTAELLLEAVRLPSLPLVFFLLLLGCLFVFFVKWPSYICFYSLNWLNK